MRIRRACLAAGLALGASLALDAGAATAQTATASAVMVDRSGNQIGTVSLSETPTGVLITTQIIGLTPGPHGYHIHEIGQCSPPDFNTAGAHYNPTGRQHGYLNPNGPHMGDMPNLIAGADGVVHTQVHVPGLTLREGPYSLLDQDGSSLVLHDHPDDYMTNPTGNSDTRVACGVIRQP